MTIAVAWTRDIKGCEELVFVTDSRLSGDGRTFDACTKAITLPRSDCAIAFAGFSGHAYPMMQQLYNAIDAHAPLRRGSMGIAALKSHALKIFSSMGSLIRSSELVSSPTDTDPEADFIFGGYNWISKNFDLWHIRYSRAQGEFAAHPPKCVRILGYDGSLTISSMLKGGKDKRLKGRIVVAGDQAVNFERLLIRKLSERGASERLDMEPFEVVRDMLRDKRHSETIGGSPQIVKVYQYMRSAPLGVYWPDKASGRIHLQGRPCLGYERTERWILDPDTLISEWPRYEGKSSDNEPAEGDGPEANENTE